MNQHLFILTEELKKYRLKNHVSVNDYVSLIKNESKTLNKNDLQKVVSQKKNDLKQDLLNNFNSFYDECSKHLTNEVAKEAQAKKPVDFKLYIKNSIDEDDYLISLFEKEIIHLL